MTTKNNKKIDDKITERQQSHYAETISDFCVFRKSKSIWLLPRLLTKFSPLSGALWAL